MQNLRLVASQIVNEKDIDYLLGYTQAAMSKQVINNKPDYTTTCTIRF